MKMCIRDRFEPERVIKGTQWAVEHPDWMLDLPSEPDGTYLLFDLGNKEAREWLCRYCLLYTSCRMIVERQHGKIWAESKLGEGSIFRFNFPYRKC